MLDTVINQVNFQQRTILNLKKISSKKLHVLIILFLRSWHLQQVTMNTLVVFHTRGYNIFMLATYQIVYPILVFSKNTLTLTWVFLRQVANSPLVAIYLQLVTALDKSVR